MQALGQRIGDEVAAQAPHLFLWTPVVFGTGIAVYFGLRWEPPLWSGLIAVFACVIAAVFFKPWLGLRVLCAFAALFFIGFSVAQVHTHLSSAPVLSFRYYGPVQGRVVAIDRSASDATRVTLDQVILLRVAPERTPARVRISLHSKIPGVSPRIGQVVAITAHLSPPSGPAEPGGFDFRRHAWFKGLGALGYSRAPLMRIGETTTWPIGLRLAASRMQLGEAVRARADSQAGALAAALATGDRSGVSKETTEALRAANLSHLLAISGLHMGLLTGFIFATLRISLSLLPVPGQFWPPQKIAAVAALVVGALYLALSGWAVATLRAYIMVGVFYIAVLIDRRAISLHSVALAALIVLVLRPEALMGPGFQMSFAATVALVAAFRGAHGLWARQPRLIKWILPVVLSSLVAGLATAPVAGAHFNRFAQFGLLANVLAVPVTGIVVIPAGVVSAILAPFGGAELALWAMELGCAWILWTAEWVSALPNAVRGVVQPQSGVLGLYALGGLFFILWLGPIRWAGLGILAVAVGLWANSPRPDILIAESGGLVGVRKGADRALSRVRGDGFVAQVWLENDGSLRAQKEQAPPDLPAFVQTVTRKKDIELAQERCLTREPGLVVITNRRDFAVSGCVLIGPKVLLQTGALTFDWRAGDLKILSANAQIGHRPWMPDFDETEVLALQASLKNALPNRLDVQDQ